MAYTAMMRRQSNRPHRSAPGHEHSRQAAATAVGLTYAALTFGAADSECYAMIDNRMIDDRAAVAAMVEAPHSEMWRRT